jgi:hypothetical protein
MLGAWVAGCAPDGESSAKNQENPAARLARYLDEAKREGNTESSRVSSIAERGHAAKGRADTVSSRRASESASPDDTPSWNPEEGVPFVHSEHAFDGGRAPPAGLASPLPPDELAHRIRAEDAIKRLRGEEVFEMTVGWPDAH